MDVAYSLSPLLGFSNSHRTSRNRWPTAPSPQITAAVLHMISARIILRFPLIVLLHSLPHRKKKKKKKKECIKCIWSDKITHIITEDYGAFTLHFELQKITHAYTDFTKCNSHTNVLYSHNSKKVGTPCTANTIECKDLKTPFDWILNWIQHKDKIFHAQTDFFVFCKKRKKIHSCSKNSPFLYAMNSIPTFLGSQVCYVLWGVLALWGCF